MGRIRPSHGLYRSVEHNIDMMAFARMLGADDDRRSASRFVKAMFMQIGAGWYSVGTRGDTNCDKHIRRLSAIPTDGAVWSVAAGADTEPNKQNKRAERRQVAALKMITSENTMKQKRRLFARRGMLEVEPDEIGANGTGLRELYHGFRFSNRGHGIQWEITASAVVAFLEFDRKYGSSMFNVSEFLPKPFASLKKLLRIYKGIPASLKGGNYNAYKSGKRHHKFPGGSDTGLGWSYFRYPHVAATAWTGFSLLMQKDDEGPVDGQGNPFAQPDPPVPRPETDQCQLLPQRSSPDQTPMFHDQDAVDEREADFADVSDHDEFAELDKTQR